MHLQYLSEPFNNLISKVAVIQMNRFQDVKATYDIMINEVGCIGSCICQGAVNLCPTRDLFDHDTDLLKSKLIFWKGASEIDISMSEYI